MPSPDQVNQFLSALKQQGGSAGNVTLREALGWDEAIYDAVRGEAISQGKVAAGRGRGGSMKGKYRGRYCVCRCEGEASSPSSGTMLKM